MENSMQLQKVIFIIIFTKLLAEKFSSIWMEI